MALNYIHNELKAIEIRTINPIFMKISESKNFIKFSFVELQV